MGPRSSRGLEGAIGPQGAQGANGPQGPQGARGPALTETMQSSGTRTFTTGTSATLSVSCPDGAIATAGGYRSSGNLILSEDTPVGDSATGPTGWEIAGISQSGNQSVTVYAICSSGGAA